MLDHIFLFLSLFRGGFFLNSNFFHRGNDLGGSIHERRFLLFFSRYFRFDDFFRHAFLYGGADFLRCNFFFDSCGFFTQFRNRFGLRKIRHTVPILSQNALQLHFVGVGQAGSPYSCFIGANLLAQSGILQHIFKIFLNILIHSDTSNQRITI